MFIPLENLTRKQLKLAQLQCTYKYQPMGEPVALKVRGYYIDEGYICLPRQYGLKLCNQLQLEWEDDTSAGKPIKFPKMVTPRAYQATTLDEIYEGFENYYDLLFKAHTGWGKTIGALITAAKLGRSTLIVVDQENLKAQWLEVLVKFFGFKESEVGIVQGDECSYKGKAVTIAMVQTLTQRDYPEEFYQYFGCFIGDEVHTIGAPTFSQILLRFPAMYRLFVSATPKRGDGLQRALDFNCGPVRIAVTKKHEESAVYIVRSPTVYSFYGNISPKVGRIINEVADDAGRNLVLAESIQWLYQTGRPTLVVSDRIEHLQALMNLCKYMGVPAEEMGMYTGYEVVWKFGKDPAPPKRPRGLQRWENEEGEVCFAEYSAVGMIAKQKVIPAKKLLATKENAAIIFATYGKFTKGVDEPRLCAGVDATPRAKAEQLQGRILRELDGKLKPIWVTLVDDNNYRLVHAFCGRIREYLKSNARLYEWDGDGEATLWDAAELLSESKDRVEELKGMDINPRRGGGYELVPARLKKAKEADEMKAKFASLSSRRKESSPKEAASGRLKAKGSTRRG